MTAPAPAPGHARGAPHAKAGAKDNGRHGPARGQCSENSTTEHRIASTQSDRPISYLAQFGAALIAQGYRFVPIQPGTKKPGQVRSGAWCDYPQWSRHARRDTTAAELDLWSRWPGAGVGVLTGEVIAIDIDVCDEQVAAALQELAMRQLGPTPAMRIGKAPKRLLLYRATEPFAGFRRHPIEVLGLGQQFVAYGRHPETGLDYTWPVQALTALSSAQLPAISKAQARDYLAQAYAQLPPSLRPATLGFDTDEPQGLAAGSSGEPGDEAMHELRGTPEGIAQALAFVPNVDLDYDSWIRIGLALKGALGAPGEALFAAWSAQSRKNDIAITQATWASLKPQRIGAGTVYKLALQRGWSPPADLALCGALREEHPARHFLDRVHDAAAPLLIESACQANGSPPYPARLAQACRTSAQDPQPKGDPQDDAAQSPEHAPEVQPALIPPKPLPAGWDRLDGLLGALIALMTRSAKRPQPVLALGASLCLVGTLMGRNYATETDARPNLYVVGIAASGAGKNFARAVTVDLLSRAGLLHCLGGNKIASGSGLIAAVQRQPVLLFQIDEFGMFLSAAADRKRSPRYLTEIIDHLTELYTASHSVHLGIEYALRAGREAQRAVHQPCVSLYGTTTPTHFWRALQAANVVDGSLARFVVLRSENDYPDPNPDAGRPQPSAALIEALRLVHAGGTKHGMVAPLASAPEVVPVPQIVRASDRAKAVFADLEHDTLSQMRKTAHDGFAAILARVEENAQKLALIRAVSNDASSPRIEEADATWAVALARHCAEQTIREVIEQVSENETESIQKRALKMLRDAGPSGMSRTAFCRKTPFLDLRQREALLRGMQDAGLISQDVRPSGGRPLIWLHATH